MAVQHKTYTNAEFATLGALAENVDKILELIDGEIVEKMPSFTPSRIAMNIGRHLGNFLEAHDLGYVTGEAGGYVMSEGNVFNPDVAYISKSRLPQAPEREVPMAPDLAVEVKSPTDTKRAMRRKAEKYLASGTQIVWLVFPVEQIIEVYESSEDVRVVAIDGTLDGGVVLPDFHLSVRNVFGIRP